MAATTATEVLFYVPNLIGYVRLICMFVSFAFATTNWQVSVGAYIAAFFGDVIDGHVARALNQSSEYGGVLDMVTDRVSTLGLLVVLSHLYPSYLLGFITLIVIDIMSHWFHVVSSKGHHKSKENNSNRNWLMRMFYEVYPFFAYCCVGAEFFYILLYVLYFMPGNAIVRVLCFYVCGPGCFFKQLVNISQWHSAAMVLAEADAATKGKKK